MAVLGAGQRKAVAENDRLAVIILKDNIFVHQIQ
jgi:hypothetical protein